MEMKTILLTIESGMPFMSLSCLIIFDIYFRRDVAVQRVWGGEREGDRKKTPHNVCPHFMQPPFPDVNNMTSCFPRPQLVRPPFFFSRHPSVGSTTESGKKKKKKNKNSFGTSKWLNKNTPESKSRQERIREKTAKGKKAGLWSINPHLEKAAGTLPCFWPLLCHGYTEILHI
jgi:hypothetical protein